MYRKPIGRSWSICLLAAGCACTTGAQSLAGNVEVEVDGKACAKGLLLLRATFPVQGKVGHVNLHYSRDGEEFQDAGIGLPRPWQLFMSGSSNEEGTTVLVPAVARFRIGEFRFDEPGTHFLRWSVGIKDVKGFTFEQVLELEPPRAVDLAFLAGFGDENLARYMFGEDFFERQTGNAIEHYADPEVRAVKVIGRLLYATRDHWVGDIMRQAGPKGDRRKAGELLLALAKKNPESSYAPYAAYYAGCCYWAVCFAEVEDAIRARNREGELQDDLELGKYRAAFITKDQGAARACEAFTLAARRADDYLKPRVLYQHAFLRLTAFDFDEAERLLVKGAEVLPGEGTVQEWIEKARKGLEALKAKLEDAADEEGDTPKP